MNNKIRETIKIDKILFALYLSTNFIRFYFQNSKTEINENHKKSCGIVGEPPPNEIRVVCFTKT